MLHAGTLAPDFQAPLPDGTPFHLSEALASGPMILYFYPRDFTTGCTIEAKLFRDSYDEVTHLNARILGISTDSNETHAGFRSACALPFPLLSDGSRRVSQLYDTGWFGGIGMMRVTYVIDRHRTIRAVFHHELVISKHLRRTLEILRTLYDEDHHRTL